MDREITIERVCSCKSLSGASALTYHIGNRGDGGLLIRVFESSGRGLFCKDWVPVSQVETLLSDHQKQFSSKALGPLYKGKSANSCGFLMAALLEEGLVVEPAGKGNGFALGGAVTGGVGGTDGVTGNVTVDPGQVGGE